MDTAHIDPAYAATDTFHRVVAHGMPGAGLISTVLGTKLPGPAKVYLAQDLQFRLPVGVGDTVTATLTVREKRVRTGDLVFACRCVDQADARG